MSYYMNGLGDVVLTATYVAEGFQLNTEVQALDSQVQTAQARLANATTYGQWQDFVRAWQVFYDSNIASPPLLPVTSDSDLKDWAAKVDAWRTTVATWGSTGSAAQAPPPATPSPVAPRTTPTPDDEPPPALASDLTLAMVGGAVAVIGAGTWLMMNWGRRPTT